MFVNTARQRFSFPPLKRYLVVLADRSRGRFFTIYLGNFEDEAVIINHESLHKAKVYDIDHVDQHIRDHLYKHLLNVGLKALEFTRNKRIDGVLIGGHKELIKQIWNCLPKVLKGKTIGEFNTEINLPLGDLTDKVKKLMVGLKNFKQI